jgi:hypothetical protein
VVDECEQHFNKNSNMDINTIYLEIIDRLKAANYEYIIDDLEKASAGAFTGSEGLLATGYYLANLKTNNPQVYQIIEVQIGAYIDHCKKRGLIIRY